jgi:hypothetical protein
MEKTNAWLEHSKYSVFTLNNIDCYACVTGRPNPKLSPSPWDGPLTLLVWNAWLLSSRKGQLGAMGLP